MFYLGGHGFSVYGFKKDKTKTFEEVITGVEIKGIAMYAIYPAPDAISFRYR